MNNTKLSKEDYNKLIEYRKQPELTIVGTSHVNYYYGVQSKIKENDTSINLDDVKDIESILKKVIPNFVEFSNFTENGRIRCQTMWDSRFQGVSYFTIKDFKPKD